MTGATTTGAVPSDLRLLPMRERHLPAVVALEMAVQPHPWTRGMFHSELQSGREDRRWTIAAVGTDLAGFCGLWLSLDELHITNIAVAPGWQRHRVGQRLMVDAGYWALQRGATDITLEVRASNRAAQALYRKFGLAPVGLRRNYYAESGEDALIMTASGIGQPPWRQRLARLAAEVGDPGAGELELGADAGIEATDGGVTDGGVGSELDGQRGAEAAVPASRKWAEP